MLPGCPVEANPWRGKGGSRESRWETRERSPERYCSWTRQVAEDEEKAYALRAHPYSSPSEPFKM